MPVPMPMQRPLASQMPPPLLRAPVLPPAPAPQPHLPWILVGALGVAVVALVAYIVM
jgi:hypothetical protein